MFLLRRPSDTFIAEVVDSHRESDFTYEQVGLTRDSSCPKGYAENRWHAVIANGEPAFWRAKDALADWQMLQLGWIEVVSAPRPIHPSGLICTLVRTVGIYALNVAKIVYVDDGELAHQFGFGYGTLPGYPISGEERFRVSFDPDSENVTYEVFSFSRPYAFLVTLGRPIVRRAQRRFYVDSTAAMRAACQQ